MNFGTSAELDVLVRFNHNMVLSYPKRMQETIGASVIAGLRAIPISPEYMQAKNELLQAVRKDLGVRPSSMPGALQMTTGLSNAERKRVSRAYGMTGKRARVTMYSQDGDEKEEGSDIFTIIRDMFSPSTVMSASVLGAVAVSMAAPSASGFALAGVTRMMLTKYTSSALFALLEKYSASTKTGIAIRAAYLGVMLTAIIHCGQSYMALDAKILKIMNDTPVGQRFAADIINSATIRTLFGNTAGDVTGEAISKATAMSGALTGQLPSEVVETFGRAMVEMGQFNEGLGLEGSAYNPNSWGAWLGGYVPGATRAVESVMTEQVRFGMTQAQSHLARMGAMLTAQLGVNLVKPELWGIVEGFMPSVFSSNTTKAQEKVMEKNTGMTNVYIGKTKDAIAAAVPIVAKMGAHVAFTTYVMAPAAASMFGQDKKKSSRKCPTKKAKECKGAAKKGKDGKMWISKKDKNGVYRWVRKASAAKPKSKAKKSKK